MSRPKKEVTRSEVVKFKLTKEEKERIKKEAMKQGIPLSEHIRRKLSLPSNNIYNDSYWIGGNK